MPNTEYKAHPPIEGIIAPPIQKREKPELKVIEGGKKDWDKLYLEKQKEAEGLFSDLKAKYKKGKWDKEDTLYKEWLITRRQVMQIEEIQKREKEAFQQRPGEKRFVEFLKKTTKREEDFPILLEAEEKNKLQQEIAESQLASLEDAFDSAEIEKEALKFQVLASPEIAPEPQKKSLREETDAADRKLLEKLEKAAKQLVEAEDNLKQILAKRKNLFLRALLKLGGQKMPEEINYKEVKKDFETALGVYEMAWKEAEEAGVFSGRASSRLLKMSTEAHEKAEFLTQKQWVKKV